TFYDTRGRCSRPAPCAGRFSIRNVPTPHLKAIGEQQPPRAVGPLDHRNPAGFKTLSPPGVRQVDSLEAVQVDVKERKPSASVLAKDDERRARDVRRIDPETDRNAAREDRLPRPELA